MATHEEIVHVLTKIYTLLISFGYVKEADMRWAPHSASEFDRDLCREFGLHDSAISLLEKIPWTIAHQPLTPHAPFVNWSDESAFPASRYPTFAEYYQDFENELAGEALEGQFVPLAFGEPPDKGLALVIDTQQGCPQTHTMSSLIADISLRNSKRVSAMGILRSNGHS